MIRLWRERLSTRARYHALMLFARPASVLLAAVAGAKVHPVLAVLGFALAVYCGHLGSHIRCPSCRKPVNAYVGYERMIGRRRLVIPWTCDECGERLDR